MMMEKMFFMDDFLWVTSENLVNLFRKERLKGYGTYAFLVKYLNHQPNKSASIDILSSLSLTLGTKKKYLLHIIKDYHLFNLKNNQFSIRSFADDIYPLNMVSIAGTKLYSAKELLSDPQMPHKDKSHLLDYQQGDPQQESNLKLQHGLKNYDSNKKIQPEVLQVHSQQESKQEHEQPVIEQDLQQVVKLSLQQELKPLLLQQLKPLIHQELQSVMQNLFQIPEQNVMQNDMHNDMQNDIHNVTHNDMQNVAQNVTNNEAPLEGNTDVHVDALLNTECIQTIHKQCLIKGRRQQILQSKLQPEFPPVMENDVQNNVLNGSENVAHNVVQNLLQNDLLKVSISLENKHKFWLNNMLFRNLSRAHVRTRTHSSPPSSSKIKEKNIKKEKQALANENIQPVENLPESLLMVKVLPTEKLSGAKQQLGVQSLNDQSVNHQLVNQSRLKRVVDNEPLCLQSEIQQNDCLDHAVKQNPSSNMNQPIKQVSTSNFDLTIHLEQSSKWHQVTNSQLSSHFNAKDQPVHNQPVIKRSINACAISSLLRWTTSSLLKCAENRKRSSLLSDREYHGMNVHFTQLEQTSILAAEVYKAVRLPCTTEFDPCVLSTFGPYASRFILIATDRTVRYRV